MKDIMLEQGYHGVVSNFLLNIFLYLGCIIGHVSFYPLH